MAAAPLRPRPTRRRVRRPGGRIPGPARGIPAGAPHRPTPPRQDRLLSLRPAGHPRHRRPRRRPQPRRLLPGDPQSPRHRPRGPRRRLPLGRRRARRTPRAGRGGLPALALRRSGPLYHAANLRPARDMEHGRQRDPKTAPPPSPPPSFSTSSRPPKPPPSARLPPAATARP